MNKTFDLKIFLPAVLLSLIGVGLIYAATYYSGSEAAKNLFYRQFIWHGLGLAVCLAVYSIPLKFHEAFAFLYYFAAAVLLIVVLFMSRGSTSRWLHFGSFNIQPAEIAKMAAILALARFMSFRKTKHDDLNWVLAALIIMGVPALLTLVQPDLGSSLVFFAVFVAILFWSGLSVPQIILVISPVISVISAFHWITWGIFFFLLILLIFFSKLRFLQGAFFLSINLAVGMITPVLWNQLHDYQKMRIITFLDPGQDPRGAGYQIIQSKIAVGAGGFFGQGFLKGIQTKLDFLPEQHTDFIFSVLAEQFGFLGCMVVIALFFWLFYRGFSVALKARNQFYSYAACGMTAVLVFQVMINIGMTIGLMPVTGLPLPFLSYGGSSLIFFWACIGFLLAFNRDWQEY